MSSKIFCKSWGAEYIAADVVRFRLWATGQQKVMLRLAGKDQEMQASGDGWFTLDVSGVTPGTEYNFVLSDGMVVPDPASRAQKTDVNGPSYVIDPGSYAWRNTGWKGSRWEQAVVYEMHTGTFTPEGTFHTAIAKLPYLAELGVTVIEVMPVAQFGGERGWGYDGVLLFVDFIQNHDQVGNRAQGDRLITLAGAERTKVLLATLLLSPHIPLLFMGEEYGESRPFLFFTDFHGDLARAVREGRAKEFADHAGENVPDPNAPETFQRSKLNWKQQHSEEGKAWLAFTRELLLLRQKHIVPLLSAARESSGTVLQTAPGFIAVSWRFPGGTLSLALNISATTVLLPDLPGKTLFAWPNESTGSLSQHSLIVRLAQGESAS
ncbi:TPA: DUF3459 domain-containing protein [Salmonella enterica subsp. enterica serovar Typhi]|nr:DUF3459 domain-containing protein [Salmonella enterica]HDW4108893.1 DUF3459 domain-containing protein [Salmonella enterica subsp. enterica serovar Typhi]HDW4241189.1 DUF3459 domain-containing protein [Salmonella enterica subsp. enterica serovar Typhi]HDW4473433.1 DUF3459 domain-containing protein [Salmonella enterica subsp. enterica serovar Typhi]HDW5057536.1 DUF3459 domain-containing protein [Salmonella enterica subsp. enterica serovar Typhi]